MATTWESMPELGELAATLKKTFKEDLWHIEPERILYASFSKKKSKIAGKIGRIPERFSIFLTNYDYFLEIHKETWIQATEGKRLYILLHELYHIPAEGFDTNSKQYKKLKDHDLIDFRDLIKKFGVDLEKTDTLIELIKKQK